MKKIPFEHTILAATAYTIKDFPKLSLPEIACVGRSNVGKSSLINHLTQTNLAKTSSVPGKTQSINFYVIDQQVALVDLPGYGYAKVPKELRAKWAEVIDNYFETRSSLRLILFLIDARREFNEEDIAFAKWAEAHNKPLVVVFTKADKVKSLKKEVPFPSAHILYYSIKDQRGRIELIKKINNLIGHGPHQ